jgi:hypothetical protein
VRVGVGEQAGVEVRVQGLVLNGREGKVRNAELLNIQNAIFGKGGRDRTSAQESGSNIREEKPEMKFRIWCLEASYEVLRSHCQHLMSATFTLSASYEVLRSHCQHLIKCYVHTVSIL